MTEAKKIADTLLVASDKTKIDDGTLVLSWKVRFAQGKLYKVSLYHQRALEEFESLDKWSKSCGVDSVVNKPKYQAAIYSKMA